MGGPPAGVIGAGGAGRHGGDRDAHRRRFPGAPEPLLDLSTGINPYSWPHPAPLPARDAATLARLPQPASLARLERQAGHAYAAGAGTAVLALPGTAAAIRCASSGVAGGVAIVSPTYGGHASVLDAIGAAPFEVPDLDQAIGSGARLVILCRPNNPDGQVADAAAILEAARGLASRGGALVVDEAFADLERDPDALARACPHPGLVLTRSFGKTYGLPGLRLAFALGETARLAVWRGALGPWPIAADAIALGTAALADEGWRRQAADRLAHDGAALDAVLARAGCVAAGGTALFRLVRHREAGRLADRLGAAGIMVRAFGAGLPGALRFGIPDRAGLARLRDVLDAAGVAKELESGGTGE